MKILFVVTAFYPEQAIGSVRITKFVKFLHRAGHEVTVLSLEPAPWSNNDESLWFQGLESVRWTVVPQSKIFKRVFARARSAAIGDRPAVHVMDKQNGGALKIAAGWLKSKAQLAYSLLKALDWMIQVRRAALRMRYDNYDLIFSSYPSFASPFAGVMLKRMGLAENLLIDFRDPVSYGITSKHGISRWIETWLGDQASVTSYASKGVRAKVESVFSESAPRGGKVVTNGYDPDDLREVCQTVSAPIDPRVMRFVYVGSLYGGKRDLSIFFKALSRALKETNELLLEYEVIYAGQEGDVFIRQAKAHGLSDLVKDYGRVSRHNSLLLQQQADICLLSTWNTLDDQGVLPGKIFEFFLMRKPVLAIVNGTVLESEVGAIIDEVNAGFCFEEGDPARFIELTEWLVTAIREKYKSGVLVQKYASTIDNYNIEKISLDLFEGLAGHAQQRLS